VTVNDTEPPTISCAGDITQPTDTDTCTAVVTFEPTAIDNCPGVTVTSVPASGSEFPKGVTAVHVVATDAAGNTSECWFNVTVVDQQKPTITLLGANPITIECAQYGPGPSTVEWGDPGATVTDNCDGIWKITSTSAVLKDAPTSYTVTYTAQDADGNEASPVTRTVLVVDTTAPVITLLGPDPLRVAKGGPFVDPGATVSDACATGLVASVSGTVDLDVPGDYVLTYTSTDGTNSAEPVTRTVKVNHPPVTEDFFGAGISHLSRWGRDINLAAHTSDADGDPLTYSVGTAAHGTVTVNAATGMAHYTPIASHDFVGDDTFTYTASDGRNSSTSTVEVELYNDTPMFSQDYTSASVSHKTGSEVDFEYNADDEDGDRVTMQVVKAPTYGTLPLVHDDDATYRAGGANVTSDSFQLVAVDPHGARSPVRTFNVILTNTAPVAGPGTASVPHRSTTGVDIDLKALVSDAESDPLTFAVGSPDYGTVTVNAGTGLAHYTPGTSDVHTPAHFTYTANDGRDTSIAGTVTVTLTNTPPVADVSLAPEAPKVMASITATIASCSDADGDDVTFAYRWLCNGNEVSGQTTDVYTGAKACGDVITVEVTPFDGCDRGSVVTDSVTVVNSAPAISPIADQTVQYSDPIGPIDVTFSDPDNDPLEVVNFDGPPDIRLEKVAGNQWKVTGTVNSAPGDYTVTIRVTDGITTVVETFTLHVVPEDARVTYTGALFVSTGSVNSSDANVMLSVTVQDITDVDPGDPDYDPDAGSITNATVTFLNCDTVPATVLAADVPVGLVDPDDPKVGTATVNVPIDIGNYDSLGMSVGVIVGGYYQRDSSEDNTVVTISKPLSNFITGGGTLLNKASAGLKAGTLGRKTNFGFNVKYNKKGTKPQGQVNIIIRSDGRVYQIKSTAILSLAVNAKAMTATFNSKASIQDITDPLAPIPVDGNSSLQITVTDRGEPGTTDSIGITLWNKAGGLWFTSNWTGTKTVEQTLSGGNVVVR